MTKQQVIEDAQRYADMAGKNIYLLRRGDKYRSASIVYSAA